MKSRIALVLVLACCCMPAFAEGARKVDAPACKVATGKLVEAGAVFDHFSPLGETVFLRHPMIPELTLLCGVVSGPHVNANWDRSGFPSNAWFSAVANLGTAVTKLTVRQILPIVRRCYQAAQKDESEMSELDSPGIHVECQAEVDAVSIGIGLPH